MVDVKDYKLPSLSFILVKSYPKGWQEFWEPIYSFSRNLGININATLEVFRLVYECVSREEEGRPVSTGFLIGDAEEFERNLPDSVGISMKEINMLESTDTIRSLFGLIDGYTSTFIIGKDGNLRGARLMPHATKEVDKSSYASDAFYGYLSVLKEVSGFGLAAMGPLKSAKLFFKGYPYAEVYFSGKEGKWAFRPIHEVLEKLNQIASQKRIDVRILQKIFNVTIRMSNHHKGGSIIIGDHKEILNQSETPRLRLGGFNILDLIGRKENHLFNLATQEFALVISREGEPKAASVRLMAKVPKNIKIELSPRDGGRHRSAAEISASTDCVAFVVSDDGPITIYVEGKRIFRI